MSLDIGQYYSCVSPVIMSRSGSTNRLLPVWCHESALVLAVQSRVPGPAALVSPGVGQKLTSRPRPGPSESEPAFEWVNHRQHFPSTAKSTCFPHLPWIFVMMVITLVFGCFENIANAFRGQHMHLQTLYMELVCVITSYISSCGTFVKALCFVRLLFMVRNIKRCLTTWWRRKGLDKRPESRKVTWEVPKSNCTISLKDIKAFDAYHWLNLQVWTPTTSTSWSMRVFSFLFDHQHILKEADLGPRTH